MRLLHYNEDGSLGLTKSITDESKLPKYAILSHTWLLDNDLEVTYDDIIHARAEAKPNGYQKLLFCGKQASKNSLEYFWIDTCCINKTNGAEVQEAIASMFIWYRNASVCYVYLADVLAAQQPWEPAFLRSRWFTRGWTLQELLAPASVEFFSAEGTRLGDKTSLEQHIHRLTNIPKRALRGHDLDEFTVAERLSWSENRDTTRKEDKAYCLLGIFGIFMPLIYGEGDNAYTRLLREINRRRYAESTSPDHVLSTLPVASEAAFNSLSNQHEPVCLSNTRTALLQELAAWADSRSEKRMLWLNGIAGTGKSTVARTICATQSEQGRLGASFFFSRGGGDVSNAKKLITTLARQLVARIPSTKRLISDAVAEQPDIPNHSFRDQWNHLILGPLSKMHAGSSPPAILFVIDALDECDDEKEIRAILDVFATAQSLRNVNLRILLTSRPEIAIRHSVGRMSESMREVLTLHEIAPDLVDEDLGRYFERNLSILSQERDFGEDWPGMRIIRLLVEISAGLFLWASTACRFIREGRGLAMKRVEVLLHRHRSERGPEGRLDQIYTSVLRDSVPQDYSEDEKEEMCAILRGVLGSIVVLASPLAMDSLACLLATPLGDIKNKLADLHTILYIPNQISHPIRLHHPALRDFLLDKTRCSDLDFWVDEKQAHSALAENCLRLMKEMLKRDMCGLESPGTSLEDVDRHRVQQHIPPALQYACLYWARHYQRSGASFSDGDRVHCFLQEHFLFWLEAVHLMGKSAEISAIMRLYHSLLSPSENARQLSFVRDARRFIFAFQSIMKRAPLQVYCSGIAFVKPHNELKGHFRGQIHPWIAHIQIAGSTAAETRDEFNYVNDLAWTPDGRRIASGSNTNVARFWDVPTGKVLWKFRGATDKISSVSISPDGNSIAAGSDDGSVLVWDITTRAVLRHFRGAHAGWVNSVTFSPDGTALASGAMDQAVVVWDLATGQELRRFDNQSSCVNSVTFSPDGKLIATGSVDHMVRLWDVSRHPQELLLVLSGHSGCVNSIRFSLPSGKRLVSGSDDLTVRVWDVAKGADIQVLRGHTGKVVAAIFSPSGRLVVSGSEDMSVRIWDATSGEQLHTLVSHTSGINAVVFSPNGRLLASGSFDDEVRLWDAETWDQCGKLDHFDDDDDHAGPEGGGLTGAGAHLAQATSAPSKAHGNAVTCVVFSPDGQLVASGSEDSIAKVWSRKGTELRKLEGHSGGVTRLAFSPDGRILASASKDKTAKLWDAATGAPLHSLEGHSDSVLLVLFSSDGRLLALGSADATVTLWSVATGGFLGRIEDHTNIITDIAFSQDGHFLASCSADATIVFWDLVEAGASTEILRGHSARVNSISFSAALDDGGGTPDSELLLVSSSDDGTIRTWDIAKGGVPCGLVIRGDDVSPVYSVAFSPDMRLIASCSANGTVVLWDRVTVAPQGSILDGMAVRQLSFSRCGRYLETDRGVLDIGPFSQGSRGSSGESPPLVNDATRSNVLFVTEDWVRRNSENAIWLPDEYRATDVATAGDVVVMGHRSGAVTFILMSAS